MKYVKINKKISRIAIAIFLFLGICLTVSTDSLASSSSSILYVTSSVDNNNPGSLRWAINQSNLRQGETIIDLTGVEEVIELETSLPPIMGNLTVMGNSRSIISGHNQHRVLYVKGGKVTLKQVQIIKGFAQGDMGQNGGGGSAGMGGGLFMEGGEVKLVDVTFAENQARGGNGSEQEIDIEKKPEKMIKRQGGRFYVNRGAIVAIDGISLGEGGDSQKVNPSQLQIESEEGEFIANRGAVAGVNGIGVNGIGAITFGGGGGFGGFGNAGNGGNGGNGGINGGSGGNGGNGGNGGVGFFGSFGTTDGTGTIGNISFGGGGGFGGFGNAGNGGNGGNICVPMVNSPETEPESEEMSPDSNTSIPESGESSPTETIICGQGGDGGNGGNGGFGGGGGSGGIGGNGGLVTKSGNPGQGGFGGGNGGTGFGGGGAGLGGGIFVKSGTLILENTNFSRNFALAGLGKNPGLGKGGAIFVLEEELGVTDKAQVISLQSLPNFEANMASDADNLPTDNSDIFGSILIK